MAQLICDGLALGYDGRKIVEDITFSVEAGDYLCIVGENGAGKSTLMNTLLGLHKPMEGVVLSGDGLKKWEIGYLPQQTETQRDFPASVWEVVLSGNQGKLGMRPFYNREEKQRARECMKRLGIDDIAGKCYRELSGGQQQRVLLARAITATSKMILLDEPVTGLDPVVTDEMYSLISNLNKEDGITVIMISHDLGAALKYATRILHLGEEVFFGSPEEWLESEVGRIFVKGGEA